MPHALIPMRPLRGRRLLAGAALALALPVAGCGGGSSGGSGDTDPASVVPARAALYAEVTVRPDGDQAAAVRALGQKIGQTDDVAAELVKAIDKGLKKDGGTFKTDIDPWLGDRVAVAITGLSNPQNPDYAIVAAAKDTKKALASLKKGEKGLVERKYKDVTYTWNPKEQQAAAGVGDTLVIATEPALKQVIDVDKGADALGDSDKLAKTRKSVTAKRLGFLYADPAAIIDLAAASSPAFGAQAGQLKSLLGGAKASAVGAALIAAADAIRVETAVDGRSADSSAAGDAADTVEGLPAGSLLAFGTGPIGSRAQKGVAQLGRLGGIYSTVLSQFKTITGLDLEQDVLSWMGKGGLFVRAKGLADIGGALVVETSSEAKSAAFIQSLDRLITQFGAGQGVTTKPFDGSGAKGIELRADGLPFPVVIATGKGTFVVAVGKTAVQEALTPTGKLGDDAQFKAVATQLGTRPALYVDLKGILGIVDVAAGSDADYQKARKYLQAFTGMAAGSRTSGATTRSSLVIGVK